jgi:hypothetical protein
MSSGAPSSPNPEADAFTAAYRHHATTLRNWFVAYGVGGPVLFLTNDKLYTALKASGNLGLIGWTFLTGVALQVLLAFIDKYADWICYQKSITNPANPSRLQRAASWWVEANVPSVLLDLASGVLFGIATVTASWAAMG